MAAAAVNASSVVEAFSQCLAATHGPLVTIAVSFVIGVVGYAFNNVNQFRVLKEQVALHAQNVDLKRQQLTPMSSARTATSPDVAK